MMFVSAVALALIVGGLSISDPNAQEDKTLQWLLGTWWTHDADEIPWAMQFRDDGTFRSAHTYLRLEERAIDEGRYQLEGTSLTLISDKNCQGSCKGLKGHYKVEFKNYDQLWLNAQADQCPKRKEICNRPWVRISN
jgi:hypothetical protein